MIRTLPNTKLGRKFTTHVPTGKYPVICSPFLLSAQLITVLRQEFLKRKSDLILILVLVFVQLNLLGSVGKAWVVLGFTFGKGLKPIQGNVYCS